MKASISKSPISGKIKAPSSKSYTLRGLFCAALAAGECKLIHPLGSDDTEAAINVLGKVGIRADCDTDSWKIQGGSLREPAGDLYCRESAITLRFMTAISSLIPGQCRLTSAPSLQRRPIQPLIKALKQLGIDCTQDADKSLIVKGARLKGGVAELPGNISSQYISALLLIAPFADDGITLRLTTPLESTPYVRMTIECLEKFGVKVIYSGDMRTFSTEKQSYKPASYTVEGDWSSASYLLALGALSGDVQIDNLNLDSLQGDRVIIDLLNEMGGSLTVSDNSVRVRKSELKALKADLTDCTDLLPTMAILAAAAEGTSEFTGIGRARIKESDRVAAVREGLGKMGVKTTEEDDKLEITGSTASGASIDTKGDHRIAMAFSVMGTLVGDTTINEAECVSKTYPEFWNMLESLGGEVKINE